MRGARPDRPLEDGSWQVLRPRPVPEREAGGHDAMSRVDRPRLRYKSTRAKRRYL